MIYESNLSSRKDYSRFIAFILLFFIIGFVSYIKLISMIAAMIRCWWFFDRAQRPICVVNHFIVLLICLSLPIIRSYWMFWIFMRQLKGSQVLLLWRVGLSLESSLLSFFPVGLVIYWDLFLSWDGPFRSSPERI
jgi:hypothetical protein